MFFRRYLEKCEQGKILFIVGRFLDMNSRSSDSGRLYPCIPRERARHGSEPRQTGPLEEGHLVVGGPVQRLVHEVRSQGFP
jgi:hypothetical protein